MMPEEWRLSLGIPYYVMNFKQEFKENVMDYFVAEYLTGRTPNPCIACNRYVKWESLLTAQPCDWSGLYCNRTLCQDRAAWKMDGMHLKHSVTAAKDQTYALVQSDTGTAVTEH